MKSNSLKLYIRLSALIYTLLCIGLFAFCFFMASPNGYAQYGLKIFLMLPVAGFVLVCFYKGLDAIEALERRVMRRGVTT